MRSGPNRAAVLGIVTCLVALESSSQPMRLVADVAPGAEVVRPGAHTLVGDGARVWLNSPEGLFITDGTDAGTRLVRTELEVQRVVASGPTSFLVADDGVAGPEVWRTDGTTVGTALIEDRVTGEGPNPWVPLGSAAYGFRDGLVRFDRLDGGTTVLHPISGRELTSFSGGLLFSAFEPATGEELWISDGTPQGTHLLVDLRPGPASSSPHNFMVLGSSVLFSAETPSRSQLWRTDGTISGTIQVSTFGFGQQGSFVGSGVVIGSRAVFSCDTDFGYELCASDGTWAGTSVIDLVPGPGSSFPSFFAGLSTALVFQATTPATGREYWSSDGTVQGTRLLIDLRPGPASQVFGERPVSAGGLVYFTVYETNNMNDPTGIFRTDGTPVGTFAVTRATPTFWSMVELSPSSVLFLGRGGLWRSDGTPAGTFLAFDSSAPLPASSAPRGVSWVGNEALFSATTPPTGREFFGADLSGHAGLRAEFSPGPDSGVAAHVQPLVVGDDFYFSAKSSTGFQAHVYSVDAGLRQVSTTLWETFEPNSPATFTPVGSHVVFTSPYGLFSTNGPDGGTTELRSQGVGQSSLDGPLTVFQANVIHQCLGPFGAELCATDGESSWLVKDLIPGSGYSNPRLFAAGNTRVFFVANAPAQWLWTTDGTEPGTQPGFALNSNFPLTEMVVVGDTAYFAWGTDATGSELWRSDGTGAGTNLIVDLQPGAGGAEPASLTVVGNRVYFSAQTRTTGRELWVTDGTVAGTTLVADLARGPESSSPRDLKVVRGSLLWSAHRAAEGRELWHLDAAGQPRLTFDLEPGPGSSSPRAWVDSPQGVLVTASTSQVGEELFLADVDDTPPVVSARLTGTRSDAGWWTSDVGIEWLVTDPESSVWSTSGCEPRVVNADTVSTRIECSAESSGGRSMSTVVVARDTTPPQLRCATVPAVEATSPFGAVVSLEASASDDLSGVATWSRELDAGVFPLGRTRVRVSVVDHAGNASACDIDVNVGDTTPPTITCPERVLVTSADAGAQVSLRVDATDVVDEALVVTSDAPSSFPAGVTTVTLTATDDSGNQASCVVPVVVTPRWTSETEDTIESVHFQANPSASPTCATTQTDVSLIVVTLFLLRARRRG
ncbi:MAG: HYR domain-containing protein [Archangium sp.]|nr:HYR domain-containing protein [Archangium sp.]